MHSNQQFFPHIIIKKLVFIRSKIGCKTTSLCKPYAQLLNIVIPQEFQAHKKQSTGLLGRVTDSIHNMGASYMMKNRTPEFTMMHEYVQAFGEKLGSIDRITQRIVKEQSGEDLCMICCYYG